MESSLDLNYLKETALSRSLYSMCILRLDDVTYNFKISKTEALLDTQNLKKVVSFLQFKKYDIENSKLRCQ